MPILRRSGPFGCKKAMSVLPNWLRYRLAVAVRPVADLAHCASKIWTRLSTGYCCVSLRE